MQLAMHALKRSLLFGSEVGVLLIGFVVSLFVGHLFDSSEIDVAPIVFLCGLALAFAVLLLFRRKTRAWKIRNDAAAWELSKAERKLNPRRAAWRRIIGRTLLCAPALIAAFVLFFLAPASHIISPRSGHLGPFRVSIPWSVGVLSSSEFGLQQKWVYAIATRNGQRRYGMKSFWLEDRVPYAMVFGTIASGSDPFERYSAVGAARRRDIRAGAGRFTCWEFVGFSYREPQIWFDDYEPGPHQRIACVTPPFVDQPGMYAEFFGREENSADFYRIVEKIALLR